MEGRIKLHSGLGLLIVLLGVFRLYWRQSRPRPAPLVGGPKWQTKAAEFIHWAFYALFLLTPAIGFALAGLVSYPVGVFGLIEVSGWLKDNESLAELVNSAHGFSADIMTVLLALHIAAALYHQFVKHDGVIWRMIPYCRKRNN